MATSNQAREAALNVAFVSRGTRSAELQPIFAQIVEALDKVACVMDAATSFAQSVPASHAVIPTVRCFIASLVMRASEDVKNARSCSVTSVKESMNANEVFNSTACRFTKATGEALLSPFCVSVHHSG